ncbi:MAG: FHA domain-containing protein [Pseudomonadota bacterium]
MANDYKNTNELVVSDDDPTEELEVLAIERDGTLHTATSFETERTDTHQVLVLNDQDDSKALERLAAELDRVKADAIALEDEVADREKTLARIASSLERTEAELAKRDKRLSERDAELAARAERLSERDAELAARDERLGERDSELAERDQQITRLEARIESLESEARQTSIANSPRTAEEKDSSIHRELEAARRQIEKQAGQIAASKSENSTLKTQIERTEAYADQLRHQLSDRTSDGEAANAEQASLSLDLASERARSSELETELAAAREAEADAVDALARARDEHEQEIKTLRFELGEAETSSAHYASANERLLSDLMDTQSFREELGRMLDAHEELNQARIDDFRQQVSTLEAAISSHRDNLDGKGDAIRDLLEQLVRRTAVDPAADSAIAVSPPGADEVPERPAHRPADDGVARLLVGNIDDRELRFPLFKDRLTIGRTRDNDIQIKAPYMSRKHAVVYSDGNATRIIDWDSKNGVFVNSMRVTEHFLEHGDIVSIGEAEFRYEERTKRDG